MVSVGQTSAHAWNTLKYASDALPLLHAFATQQLHIMWYAWPDIEFNPCMSLIVCKTLQGW